MDVKCRRFSIFFEDIFTNMQTQISYMLLDRVWPCQSLGSFPGWESWINFQTLYCQFTVICSSYAPLKVFVLLRCAVCFFAPNKTSGRLVLSQMRERRVKSHKGRFCNFNFYSELTSMFVCFSFRSVTNQTLVSWVDYLVLYKMEKVDPQKTNPIRKENLHKHVVSLCHCIKAGSSKKLI